MRFSCAGKVFITGEYACIEGGLAILGTVAPAFDLAVEPAAGSASLPFAELSPAGLFLNQNKDALDGVVLKWRDPYETPIGVGSSSAQFLLSVVAICALRKQQPPTAEEVLRLYWRTVGTSQGLRPSGADVVAQWCGGPLAVRNEPFSVKKLPSWNSDAVFLLAYTGCKAKTHEHLRALRARGFPESFRAVLDRLNAITADAIEAWNNAAKLGAALNAYQRELTRGGLAPAEFTAQLDEIQAWTGVFGCKGSGAQGGDCVLLLVERQQTEAVSVRLRGMGWTPMLADWVPDGVIGR